MNTKKGGKRLSNRQIAEGINTAGANAARLVADAESMFKLKRYPTSLALSILSIEESGKPGILRQLSIALQETHVNTAWSDFHNHQKKNIMSSFESLFHCGARNINDFEPMHKSTNKAPRELDKLKQNALYINFVDNKKWHLPEDAIDRNTAQLYLRMARGLLPIRHVTEKEIDLYVKHLKQEKNIDLEEAKKSTIDFFEDMLRHGLLDEVPYYIYEFYGEKKVDLP